LGLKDLPKNELAGAIVGSASVVALLSILFWLPFVHAKVVKKDYSKPFSVSSNIRDAQPRLQLFDGTTSSSVPFSGSALLLQMLDCVTSTFPTTTSVRLTRLMVSQSVGLVFYQ